MRTSSSDVVKDAMEQSAVEGCQTFDGALHALCAAGRVSQAEALRAADSPNNLRLILERLAGGGGDLGEMPLRLVSPPEMQIRRQTVKIQTQQGGGAPGKSQTAMPSAGERPKR